MTAERTLQIALVEGQDAERLLGDPAFDLEWRQLHDACPWGTVFQAPSFAKVWYRVYQERRAPVLVTARDDAGMLCGLFALTTSRDDGALAHVGEHHAEYHVWLAHPEDGDRFPALAFDALAARFPGARLRLMFLPPRSPIQWVADGAPWHNATDLRPLPRPLMAVGPGSECESSLRKKGNKSRLNRLAREGEFRFVQLETRDELATVFREIIDYTDLRQGAVHDSVPFRSDPLKEELYLSMMEVPGLLHATVSMVGDRVAAAHIGARNGTEVLLGLITHSPSLASHSPGKLHVLQLGAALGRQGYDNFDLTPGGDYKERFATHHDQAYVLDLFFSRSQYLRHRLRQRLAGMMKKAFASAGIEPGKARDIARGFAERAARVSAAGVARRTGRSLRARTVGTRSEFRIYRIASAVARELAGEATLARDRVSDLLLFERTGDLPFTRLSFLSTALSRLEEGQHVYTRAENGKLLHYSWLIPRQDVSYSDYGQPIQLPAGSAVVYDDYTYPAARGHGLHRASIRQRVHDAALMPDTNWIFTGVRADNPRSWRNFERLGFTIYCRCFREVRGGRTRLWMECE